MLPHHISLPQQHQGHHLQQQQQQQQGQQNDPHHLGMTPFQEQQRNPWFQQQMLQMRNQSQNGPDMSNHTPQQMAEIMRNQNMNRMPNQQQNFSFPMGNHGLNHNQPSFLDQQNQSSPQNRMSPLGFPNNMGGPGGLPGQNPANFNPGMNRNNMMLQALQRDQNNNRQLELMSLAQNQQNQNGPFNLGNRLAPGGLGHQGGGFNGGGPPGMSQPGGPSQGDLMPPGGAEAMRRPSPHPHPPNQPSQQPPQLGGAQPGPPFGNPQQAAQMAALMNGRGGRVITLPDLQDRQNAMKSALTQLEFQIRSLTAARSQMPDQVFAAKMRSFSSDLQQKRDGLTRITGLITNMTNNGTTHMTLPVSQPPGGPAVSGGQPWMGQTMPNNSLQPPFGPTGMPGGPNNQPPQPQPNGQPSPSPAHAPAVPNGGAVRPGVQSPHNPNAGSPFSNPQTSPPNLPFNNMGAQSNPQAPQPGGAMPNNPVAANIGNNMMSHPQAPNGNSSPFPPLVKERFNITYKNWCNQKHVSHDQRLLSIDNLSIDLHTLHTEVMKEGGLGPVQQKDLWAVIAARMGCVQFPGGPNDPPKSGPAAANQLAHVYKEYLADFDRVYMSSVLENRRKQQAFQQMLPSQLRGINPQQMRMLVQVADIPAADLRAKGMPEDLVRVVENNRQALQLMRQDQNMFKNMLHPGQAPGLPNAGGSQGGLPIGGHEGGMPGQLQFNGMPPRPMGDVGAPNNMMFPPKPGMPNLPPGSAQSAKLQAALVEIQGMKHEYMSRVSGLPPVEVSNEQRLEYNNLLEQAHRTAQDMERKLPFFHVAIMARQPDNNAGNTRKLVSFIINVQQQRTMIGYSTPRFIMSLPDLRQAQNVLHTAIEYVATHWKSVAGAGPGPTAAPNPGMLAPPRPPTQPPLNPNPVSHHASPQGPPPPQSSPAPNNIPRPPVNLQPPPLGPKKKGNQTTPQLSAASPPNVVNTPTPPANPSTPAANALTPTHASSPQTPKSPKSKPPAKPRPQPKPRRPSNTVQKPSVTPTATPVTEPAQIPPPNATNGLKRPREEDEPSSSSNAAAGPSSVAPAGPSSQASGPVNEPSPPKKIKSEWDGPPSQELLKKEETVENIKTEEDASVFLDQMTRLIQMSNAEDGSGNALSVDISETLDIILKGYSAAPDGDSSSGLSSLLGGDLNAGGSSPVKDELGFGEIFDFSSYAAHGEDDAGSKANTPDLISSSSTNPSPESNNSDADPAHHATLLSESKFDEFADPLRLGGLKEIDGGESAFYQSNEWKWDMPMATLDQPWAIFNS